MKKHKHTVLLLSYSDCKYKEEINSIYKYLIHLGINTDFINICSENNPSVVVKKILTTNLSDDKIQMYKNVHNTFVHYPIIIPFIDTSKEDEINFFFAFFKKFIEANHFYATQGGDYNIRFLNILMRDLYRENVKDINTTQYHTKYIAEFLSNELTTNAIIAYKNSYNIVVDKFKSNGNSIENINDIFYQIGYFLNQIICSEDIEYFNLSSCYEPEDKNGIDSRLTYNIFGLSSVGMDQTKIAESISLKRKFNFLNEVIENSELENDKCLEITRKSETFFKATFEGLEEEIKKEALNISFQNDVEINLSKIDISSISDNPLQAIDNIVTPFKEKLKLVEEKAIKYTRKKEMKLNEAIKMYSVELFDMFNPNQSIDACIYGLESIIEPQTKHLITQSESTIKIGLTHKIINLKSHTNDIPEQGEYKKQRMPFRKSIEEVNKQIQQQQRQIKLIKNQLKIKWLTKNFFNIIILPIIGLTLSLYVLFTLPVIEIFKQKLFDISDKLIVSCIPFIVLLFWGLARTYLLYTHLVKQKSLLHDFLDTKKTIIQSYINTYNTYFETIINKIKYNQCIIILEGNLTYIKAQIEQVKQFKDALIALQNNLKNQFKNNIDKQNFFNKSLIGPSEIDFYCKKNNLSFFDKHKVSNYFIKYLDDNKFFGNLRFIDIESKVDEHEIIKPFTETFKENAHIYKEIEKYETTTFLSSTQDSHDIVYSDVKQGLIGDCYLMAALASIAHKNPEFIRDIINHTAQHLGVCFYDDFKQTHKVLLDKKFWITKDLEIPIYAQFGTEVGKLKEIWPMLIEKGWAKINGCDYSKIDGEESNGNINRVDYSLALTGSKAIHENLNDASNIQQVAERIKKHLKNKPIVFYSTAKKCKKSNKAIVTNHAYALLNFKENQYQIYDPNGSIITITEDELKYNFDTVLYFNFNYQVDDHLSGIYSDYFVKNSHNLFTEFDDLIAVDLEEHINSKTFEEIIDLNMFNLQFNEIIKSEFTSHIIDAATPYVYLFKQPNNDKNLFILGENSYFKSSVLEKLNSMGYDTETIPTRNNDTKNMGFLIINNHLNFSNISKTLVT